MYSLIESARSAWQNIKAHGFRSILTTLGIVIGVAAVIAVISVVQGLSYSITKNFSALGSNSLTVASYTPFNQVLQGRQNRLTLADYRLLRARVDDIRDVSPSFMPFGPFGTTVSHQNHNTVTRVLAATPNFQDSTRQYPDLGRFFVVPDENTRRRVCIIGAGVRDDLKLPQNPLGLFLSIGGDWFKIVGVMQKRGDLFGISQDDYVLIPFAVGQEMIAKPGQEDIRVTFNVASVGRIDAVQDRIKHLLRAAHHLAHGQDDDFQVQTAEQLMQSFSKVSDSITAVLGGIVAISLLVGGIGVMNIMLVSVTERTKEIGICKALGAQRADILLQFLIEATLLSVMGGIIGLVLGWGIGAVVAAMIPDFPPAVVPLWAAALAVGFSGIVGIIFGIIPAARAASLDPVIALHYE